MSQRDLTRFVEAFDRDPALREEFERLGNEPDSWMRRARELGYDLERDEVESLVSGARELSDEDLEDVAGGWDGGDEGGEPGP